MYFLNLLNDPLGFILFIGFIVVAVTVHEAAHAWSSNQLGDPTARLLGRITLNPIKHLDPMGSLLFLLAGFGWGRPVPVDPFNLREPRKDNALIALAGPASNLLLAAIIGIGFRLQIVPGEVFDYVYLFGLLNINLAIFNLLPVPPLDGSKLYRAITPESFDALWDFLDRFGVYILLALFISGSGIISTVIGPIIMSVMRGLGYPSL